MTIRDQDRTGWGVVATVDEPPALLAAFAAHHLSVGAREVHLFLDRPDLAAQEIFRGVEGVFLRASGESGEGLAWSRVNGLRPARHQMRQAYNANSALELVAKRRGSIAFLAHVDADEFITASETAPEGEVVDFARDGEAAADGHAWIRLRVEERAHRLPFRMAGLFDGLFRRPWVEFEDVGTVLYGPSARFLQLGISAHAAGKAVARVGAGQGLGVHRVVLDPGACAGHEAAPRLDGRMTSRDAIIRHFDGLTPLHFLFKLLRRGVNLQAVGGNYPPARLAQYREARARIADSAGLWALWDEVQGVSDATREALSELMETCATPCRIDVTARSRFPGVALDAASFDQALLMREEAVFAQLIALGFDAKAFVSK